MKRIMFLLIAVFIVPISFSVFPMESQKIKFFEAVRKGDVKVVTDLINNKKVSINAQDNDGNTALMIAVKNQKTDMIDLLLQYNQNSALGNKNRQTVLLLAIETKNIDIVNKILNKFTLSTYIDQQDEEGNTPLIYAVKTNNIDIIKAILNEAPNPQILNNMNQAAGDFAKNDDIRKLLKNAQNQYNLYATINNFMEGIDSKDPSSDIEKYIDAGASLNIPSRMRNPLRVAIQEKFDEEDELFIIQEKIVRLLIQKGADVNQHFADGNTPLTIAAWYAQPNIFKILLERHPNINVEGRDNMTPLMVAVDAFRIPIIEELLNANASMKNSKGKKALDVAKEKLKSVTDEEEQEDLKKAIKLLEIKEKEIAGKKTPAEMTTPEQLLSLLQKLTQSLKALQKMLM